MKKIIAGNWKMNKTKAQTADFIKALADVPDYGNTIVLCVPFTDIATAVSCARGTAMHIGAQNVHWAENGAFTGEISAEMLREENVEYVIIGHTERRQLFGETDESVRMRVKAAVNAGLIPIVCVGETLEKREAGKTEAVIKEEIVNGFAGITPDEMKKTVIAYEPIWAIGTGKTATSDDANNVAAYIRGLMENIYGPAVAKNLPILYGGSMNEKNAAELLSMPHINGGLIGGASLVPEKFKAIIESAK